MKIKMKTKNLVLAGCAAALLGAAVCLCRDSAPAPYVPARIAALRAQAGSGDVEAQVQLGYCYYRGDGVPRNPAEACRWWRAAAEKGSVVAQLDLGTALLEFGGADRAAEAVRWITGAAESGDDAAQLNLGLLYLQGRAVPRDLRKAAIWLHRSAAKGDATAQYNLGLMFETGQGTARDLAEARRWYARAAQGGHPQAARNLANLERQETEEK